MRVGKQSDLQTSFLSQVTNAVVGDCSSGLLKDDVDRPETSSQVYSSHCVHKADLFTATIAILSRIFAPIFKQVMAKLQTTVCQRDWNLQRGYTIAIDIQS